MKKFFLIALTILCAFVLFSCSLEADPIRNGTNDHPLYTSQSKTNENIFVTEENTPPSVTTTPPTTTAAPTTTTKAQNEEWREFLKDYEAWVDDYIAFMKKYQANPMDFSLITDYAKMTAKAAEWSQKADQIQGDLSSDDLVEYTQTLARITEKLSNLAL